MKLGEKNTIKGRTSKKQVKEFTNDFYFTILHHIKQGLNPTSISKAEKRSKQNIAFYIANLKKWGYIKKVGYGTWEVTKLGRFTTSKSFLWGTHKAPKKIELWRMGYRFYIKHDNKIAGLKCQILKNGGKVYQGRVLGCWITKGSETLDIYGTVAKSDNLWDAAMQSMNEIVACKGYIEEYNNVILEPMRAIRPDIIINTPETRRIADKVHEEMGRMRTEFFEIDESKTGKPEFEARTLNAAKNVIDNIGLANRADDIEKKLFQMTEVIEVYAQQINLHMDVMRDIQTGIKELSKVPQVLEKMSELVEKLK